jgi:integrase
VARKNHSRRRGCWVEANASGSLRFRFRWRLPGKDGLHQFSETTELMDTPANRAALAKQVAMIGADIQSGRFKYLSWFPSGTHAGDFRIPVVADAVRRGPLTISDYFHVWVAGKVPPTVRVSRARDYRNHFRRYIMPIIPDVLLAELTLADLETLKARLLAEQQLSLKTVRNVIDGSLRAMMRDAKNAGFTQSFPFPDLEWSRHLVPGPDPFTEEERDALVEYFRVKKWRLGRAKGAYYQASYYSYFAFVFTLFYTGLRPSEAVALRHRSLDLGHATLYVERSRSLGAEAAPKTAAAARLVRLTPKNVELLRELTGKPEYYVFKNTLGSPISQVAFYKLFRAAQRELCLRERDLYATKDTYLSCALTRGVNLQWLSEQTGVADATLRKHYGKFIHADARDAEELAKIDFAPRLPLDGLTDDEKVLDYLRNLVEQKGFEPSTPTLRTWCSPS